MRTALILKGDILIYRSGYETLSYKKKYYYLLCFTNGHDDMITYRLYKMEDVEIETYAR